VEVVPLHEQEGGQRDRDGRLLEVEALDDVARHRDDQHGLGQQPGRALAPRQVDRQQQQREPRQRGGEVAAVAQEETGLVGMKALYEQWKDRAVAFVDVLGDGHSITYGAITIHWWKVVASGPGGHSLNGGVPNVNQGIGRAVDRILQLPHPERYKADRVVVNVAMLQSGAVYNHKPETGWFSLDVRSLDGARVEEVEAAMQGKGARVIR